MDALFLKEHPGWTWRDLQDAPFEVIETMRLLGREQGAVAKARAERKPSGIRK